MVRNSQKPLDQLPDPEIREPLLSVELDQWEIAQLSSSASANFLTYFGHYTNGTAGRMSDDELLTMKRWKRLSSKFSAVK